MLSCRAVSKLALLSTLTCFPAQVTPHALVGPKLLNYFLGHCAVTPGLGSVLTDIFSEYGNNFQIKKISDTEGKGHLGGPWSPHQPDVCPVTLIRPHSPVVLPRFLTGSASFWIPLLQERRMEMSARASAERLSAV